MYLQDPADPARKFKCELKFPSTAEAKEAADRGQADTGGYSVASSDPLLGAEACGRLAAALAQTSGDLSGFAAAARREFKKII